MSRIVELIERLGALVIDNVTALGNFVLFLATALWCAATPPYKLRLTIRQIRTIGAESIVLVALIGAFTGMVLGLQGYNTLSRFGSEGALGTVVALVLVRELGPVLAALMVTARAGSAMAAELGSMQATEQVDALRMCAADPIDFLLVPRFLASMVMTTVLIVWAGVVAFAAGAATASIAFDVPLRTFCDMQLIDWGDLSTGLAKCVAYGAAIPIVSGYCGLSTFGGSEGVGWATTRAVVNSSLAIIVLNAIISTASLMIFGAK